MKRESDAPHVKSDSKTGEWLQTLSQFLDKVTGKDLTTTYEFQDLVIDLPKATGPDGKELGSAKWMINGKIVISSEVTERAISS